MAIENVNAGSAPILWSTIDDAFKVINDNFTELSLSVGGSGVVDLTNLASTVAPVDDNTFDIGEFNSRWRDIYLDQFIYLGGARIEFNGDTIKLPAGSTIGGNGQLLDENYFKTIRVASQDDIVADAGTDVLTMSTDTGISITTNSTTDTLTFINTGVTSLSSGVGISIDSATGSVVIANTGVTTVAGTAGQIGVSSATGSVVLTNLGVLQLTTDPGSGIGLSASTGEINITNLAPNIAQNVFRFISVPDQGTIEADNIADTLTFSPGYGILLTTATPSDTVTISLDQNIDINGSVFSDDSALLVDGVNGVIPGTLTGNWNSPGDVFSVSGDGLSVSTSSTSLSITDSGITFSNSDNGDNLALILSGGGLSFTASGSVSLAISNDIAIASGNNFSLSTSGTFTLASTGFSISGGNIVASGVIAAGQFDGDITGSVFGDNSSMLIDGVDSKIVGPVDTTTVEASVSINAPLTITSTVDSSDSSAITVIPSVVFNSDVTVENDLIASNIPGYVKLDTLKSVVADSVDFADFQARIASL